VFREPRLESGYPDVVVVVWSSLLAKEVNVARRSLRKRDYQLLQLLIDNARGGINNRNSLYIDEPKTLRTLKRLEAAGMVKRFANRWSVKPIGRLFIVREIIAIEAKIGEFKSALHQARLNTWFASRSFVLVPQVPSRGTFVSSARDAGIGIFAGNDFSKPVLKAIRHRLPRSYASWLFNEWVLRVLTT